MHRSCPGGPSAKAPRATLRPVQPDALVPVRSPDGGPVVAFPAALADEAARFLATAPYDPTALLLDAVLAVEPAAGRVLARLDTTRPLPFVDAQRGPPDLHPRHVNGGVMVHLTGMLGLLHAHFVLGLRFDAGWIGFGGRIHRAEFRALARVGPPLDLELVETRRRDGADRRVVRYDFTFTQGGERCYVGDQTATWLRGADPT